MDNNTPTKRFLLKFTTSLGRVARFSVPRACPDKNSAEVRDAMTTLMNNPAVIFEGRGTPIDVYGAQLIKTERNVII
jgi:hypothetical protein